MAATRYHRTAAESSTGERPLVAAATSYLQVQTADEATARIISLGSGSIRVGRGIQCEVRLNQVGLGDVQCMIRRKGDDWQFQPVGPPGRIWINGRSADQQQPLPIGAVLQVGRFRLTILPTDPNGQQPGSFDAPISVDPKTTDSSPAPYPAPAPVAEPPRVAQPQETPAPPEPAVDPEAASGDDRVKRWESRVTQRDQWLKDRQSEKRWEARWKAAGESIRARSTPPPPPGTPTPNGNIPNAPVPDTAAQPPIAARIVPGRPAPVRPFEPRPVFGPTRRVGDSELKSEPQRVPLRPASVDPVPETPSIPEPVVRADPLASQAPVLEAPRLALPGPVALRDEPSTTHFDRASVAETPAPAPPTVVEIRDHREEAALTDPAHSAGTSADVATDPTLGETSSEQHPTRQSAAGGGDSLAATVEVAVALDQIAENELVGRIGNLPTEPVEAPRTKSVRPSPRIIPGPATVPPPPSAEVVPPSTPRSTTGVESKPIPPRGEVKDWPTARAIFAAQGTRATEGLTPNFQPTSDRSRSRPTPEPTEAVRPEGWTIPFWLGWFPSAAAIVTLGLVAATLTGVWLEDGSSGDLAIRLSTRREGTSPTIDPQSLPRAGWWRTSASHLAAWALTLDRVGNGEDRSADARLMETEARSVSPLGARARFVAEPVPGQEADASGSIRLGPTRDVVTMTAMAHRLRRENKKTDALRAYRAAFFTASATHRSTLDRPEFRTDPQYNRFGLPHSTLLDDVARDMVEAADWSAEEWAEAIPRFGPAELAVALAIRAKDPAEAERRFKAIVGGGDEPLDPRFEKSEHRAAIAEALAEQGQWADAITQYRRAIDEETRDLDRRVWWYNLAEIARKTGDESLRNQAIESAKGVDLSDEVTQRAANAHKNSLDLHPSAQDR